MTNSHSRPLTKGKASIWTSPICLIYSDSGINKYVAIGIHKCYLSTASLPFNCKFLEGRNQSFYLKLTVSCPPLQDHIYSKCSIKMCGWRCGAEIVVHLYKIPFTILLIFFCSSLQTTKKKMKKWSHSLLINGI